MARTAASPSTSTTSAPPTSRVGGASGVSAAPQRVSRAGHGHLAPALVRAEEVAQRARDDDLALAQDADAVAEHLDVAQDVAREEHRPPALLLLDDEVAHLLAPHRVEPAHRLVEDEQLRIVHERRRERRRAGASPSTARARRGRSRSPCPTRSRTSHDAVARAPRRCSPESRPQSVTNSRGDRYG